MDVLITYDIAEDKGEESKHTEVKDGMKAKGYNDHLIVTINDKKVTYYLPNTTLWKKNTLPETAKLDLEAVAKAKKATIERLIALEFTDTLAAIPGKPYKSK